MKFFLFDLFMGVVFALGTIIFASTGVILVLCAVAAALLRRRYDRESSIYLGNISAALLLVLDGVIFGVILSFEPIDVDDAVPRYYIWMMPLIGWLIHLPMGLGMVRLGIRLMERIARSSPRR